MLERLLMEHEQILKTLNLLEMQYLEICRGSDPDYSLMRSILEYIQDYPEQIHHPLEDSIFSILLKRAGEVEIIKELIAEHTELEDETRRLKESLEMLKSGVGSKQDIKKQLSLFLVRQRQHIYVEEEKIYPLCRKTLTKKDWQHIQSTVPLSQRVNKELPVENGQATTILS